MTERRDALLLAIARWAVWSKCLFDRVYERILEIQIDGKTVADALIQEGERLEREQLLNDERLGGL